MGKFTPPPHIRAEALRRAAISGLSYWDELANMGRAGGKKAGSLKAALKAAKDKYDDAYNAARNFVNKRQNNLDELFRAETNPKTDPDLLVRLREKLGAETPMTEESKLMSPIYKGYLKDMTSTFSNALKQRFANPYDKNLKDYASTVSEDKYKGFESTPTFQKDLQNNINNIKSIVNGMGSPGEKTYNLIPDEIYGMDLTPISDIHDYDYTYPKRFRSLEEAKAHKAASDMRFYNNLMAQIERTSTPKDKASGIYEKKRKAALVAFKMLKIGGMRAFLRNKIIEDNNIKKVAFLIGYTEKI
jgi:hypothetical protein